MNERRNALIALIGSGIALTYAVFMLLFLRHSKKCDAALSKRDRNFRKVALVVSWIAVIVYGMAVLGALINFIAPQTGGHGWSGRNRGMGGGSPLMSSY